jgi:hypothetical protein
LYPLSSFFIAPASALSVPDDADTDTRPLRCSLRQFRGEPFARRATTDAFGLCRVVVNSRVIIVNER